MPNPKTFSNIETLSQTIRLPVMTAAWLGEQAKQLGSVNVFIRQLVDDARTLFGLPKIIVDKIEADMARNGMSQRDYLINLVMLRYEQIVKAESSPHGHSRR